VSPPAGEPTDWPAQATDSILNLVDNVRDKTTGPALTAARAIVYGTIIFLLAVPLAVMLMLMAMRGMEGILLFIGEKTGWAFLTDPIYLVYLTFGVGFVLASRYLFRKAQKPSST
jgi:hypothetical protein